MPAAYVKQIQSGEFFNLSKLLPNKFATTFAHTNIGKFCPKSKNVVPSKSKNNQHPAMDDCVYHLHECPNTQVSQQVPKTCFSMSLIRHAAQKHQGLGWCVYDHKFPRKAACPSLKWFEIDQQLWLLIFTISPENPQTRVPSFFQWTEAKKFKFLWGCKKRYPHLQ